MSMEVNEIDWDYVMKQFASYEGTIRSFCKEYNISQHKLYYRRKQLKKINEPSFFKVELDEKIDLEKEKSKETTIFAKDIRIEIGKANIYIPANEIAIISDIIKELAKSC